MWLSGQRITSGTLNDTTIQVTSSAGLASLDPAQGMTAYVTDLGLVAVYTGSAWAYLMTEIASQTLTATTASVTFSGIPSCPALMVRWRARASDANAAEQMYLRFNGDTGNNYLWEVAQANNATIAGSASGSAVSFIQIATICAGNATADYFSSGDVVVSGASSTTAFKTAVGKGAAFATTTNAWTGTYAGQWNSTAVISSLTIQGGIGSLVAGSTFTLYGLA